MRIRKNTTLSSQLLAAGFGGERPLMHVCHLNQSPWDVIPFGSSDDGDTAPPINQLLSPWFLPSSSSSSPRIQKFEGDDSFNGNESLRDYTGADESVVSIEKLDFIAAQDNDRSPHEEPTDRSGKRRTNGSKSKANKTDLMQKTLSFKSGDQAAAATPTAVSTISPPRRGRPCGTGKKAQAAAAVATTTNPYEFYYYSGFGPRWGKKRGGGGRSGAEDAVACNASDDSIKNTGGNKDNRKSSSSSSVEENGTATFGGGISEYNGLEYMEEEDDAVNHDNDNGTLKKRARKPVKARSLKSLMRYII